MACVDFSTQGTILITSKSSGYFSDEDKYHNSKPRYCKSARIEVQHMNPKPSYGTMLTEPDERIGDAAHHTRNPRAGSAEPSPCTGTPVD